MVHVASEAEHDLAGPPGPHRGANAGVHEARGTIATVSPGSPGGRGDDNDRPGEPRVSTVVRAIEDIWADLCKLNPDIGPNVQVVIGAPPKGVGGHWVDATWRHHSDEKKTLDELFISGELLISDPDVILTTIIHEAAHSMNFYRGVKDTSREGRYHNKHYAAAAQEAQELGLVTVTSKLDGVLTPTIASDAVKAYAPMVKKIAVARRSWRRPSIKQSAPPKRDRDAYCTNCDLHGRLSKRWVEAGLIHEDDGGTIVMDELS